MDSTEPPSLLAADKTNVNVAVNVGTMSVLCHWHLRLPRQVDKKLLTDGADEFGKNDSGAEISLQVADDDATVELLQIVVRPVRVDLSTLSHMIPRYNYVNKKAPLTP